MAASSPLHRDASASRQPSSHSLHGITASNAALPSHKHEGLVGPLRPWSGSRSCGAPPRPRSHLRAPHALMLGPRRPHAQGAVRVRPCPWICQATTMRRTAGIKNKIRTRVERREKPSDRLPPYLCLSPASPFFQIVSGTNRGAKAVSILVRLCSPCFGHTNKCHRR